MSAESKKAEGNTAFAAKDYDLAIEKYTEAIGIDGSNHVYYSNRSAVYLAKEEWDKAEADASKCVELNDVFIKGYFRLATAQMELGKYDEAMATARKGTQKNPGNNELGRLMRTCKARKAGGGGSKKGGMSQQFTEEMMDLQQKYQTTGRELNSVSAKMQANMRDQKRTQITKDEFEKLPEGVKAYRSVGKMFLCQGAGEVDEFLKTETARAQEVHENLSKQQAYLKRSYCGTLVA